MSRCKQKQINYSNCSSHAKQHLTQQSQVKTNHPKVLCTRPLGISTRPRAQATNNCETLQTNINQLRELQPTWQATPYPTKPRESMPQTSVYSNISRNSHQVSGVGNQQRRIAANMKDNLHELQFKCQTTPNPPKPRTSTPRKVCVQHLSECSPGFGFRQPTTANSCKQKQIRYSNCSSHAKQQ